MSFDYKRILELKDNLGEKEKKYRIIGGSIAIAISIFTASIFLLLVGLILVATGYTGKCPAYAAFDKNTLDSNTAEE